MRIIISIYDDGYYWEILVNNCGEITNYTKSQENDYAKTIVYNYGYMYYYDFIEWLYAKGYREIIICDNGSICYEQKENKHYEYI